MILNRTMGWYEQRKILFELQVGKCAICLSPLRHSAMCIDHDHDTGMTRGLLCRGCNTAELGGSPRSLAYSADPPAASFKWEWQSQRGKWWLDTHPIVLGADDRQRAAAITLETRFAELGLPISELMKETP